MIRLFTALCKSFFDELSELSGEQIFQDATDGYNHYGNGCPRCGAVGKLEPHGGYSRWLVHRQKRKAVDSRVRILRFKCKSCGATHALLPDLLVPRSIYSLQFKLLALIAYSERETTVANICESFGIAISTLYEWKKLLVSHIELLVGILMSRKTPALEFLRNLIHSKYLSDELQRFFKKYGFSFMQAPPVTAARSNPP